MYLTLSFRISAENGRRLGSCVEKRPCGFEAACRQLDNNYYLCICPQDLSEPTDDLKCLTRKTGNIIFVELCFYGFLPTVNRRIYSADSPQIVCELEHQQKRT